MKITAIRTHILTSELAQPFAFSQGWVGRHSATLVEVTTDGEMSGWGAAFAQGMEAPQISAAVYPFRRELITQPIELSNGMVKIPHGPGLGIEIVTETLDKYRVR